MTDKTPLVDALTLLDSYATSHDLATSSLKSAIWNISKARRQKGGHGIGFSYSAHDVREELRAHSKLKINLKCTENYEPGLTNDDEAIADNKINKDGNGDGGKPVFELEYGYAKKINEKVLQKSTMNSSSLHDCGVRRRRGGDNTGVVSKNAAPNQWSEEEIADEEEEKLRNLDPIELFGAFPPRELKLAQKKARESLEYYVDAANKAAEILRLIQNNK